MDFVRLLLDAQAEVEASPLYSRFIVGTPLSNDIAVWMAEFAVKAIRDEFAGGNQGAEAERSVTPSASAAPKGSDS